MVKNVRVTVTGPIPINVSTGALTHGTHGPMPMGEKDLFKCIAAGAVVNEVVTPDLQIRLDFTNYQTNNVVSSVKRRDPIPNTVDAASINNGPYVKNVPITLDMTMPMAESKEAVVEEEAEEDTNVEEAIDVASLDNESPKHWQAPPKEKRNRKH